MMDHQVNRGDLLYSENVHEVYTILFVNDIDRDNLLLIDTYMPRNQLNHVRMVLCQDFGQLKCKNYL